MSSYRIVLLALLVAVLCAACAKTDQPPLDLEKSQIMMSSATVEAIDLKERLVTLRDAEGTLFTISVGEEVVNLPQVRVGDVVDVSFAEVLTVRKAEADEIEDGVTKVVDKAVPGEKPAVVSATEVSVTATIVSIDRTNDTVTLQMKDGSYQIVKVGDPTNLAGLQAGDRIVIVYREAVGVFVRSPNG
ncbi:MAG: hypothetical protein ACK5PS_17320 [Desulfopila sp.]